MADDEYTPEGYTREEWEGMIQCANATDFSFLPSAPRKPRCIEDHRDGKSYVYFIGGDREAIKIGVSIAPVERAVNLSFNSPIPLRILAKVEGARTLEREYHARFAAHRLHGEWFERCPEILAEIERLSIPARETVL